MTIKPHTDEKLLNKIEKFEKLGGCILFKVFEVEPAGSSYQVHLEVAKKTLLEISQENYFDKLQNSGVQISVKDFFGPQFDLTQNKPLIKGVEKLYNSYFYYDTEENEKNIINFAELEKQFHFQETDGVSGAFCGAFLEPPYSLRIGNNIFELGKYFLDFCNLLFSDFRKIEIYKWSVDSSEYFEAGKEWWGAHFWTIYNPIKNIYIGAAASATD